MLRRGTAKRRALRIAFSETTVLSTFLEVVFVGLRRTVQYQYRTVATYYHTVAIATVPVGTLSVTLSVTL